MRSAAPAAHQRRISDDVLAALVSGVTVEEILDAVADAVARKAALAGHERSKRYQHELRLFYDRTLLRLGQMRAQIDADGRWAMAASRAAASSR